MVLKLPIGTKGQNEIYVDTYKLPNGIYIYSLVTDGRLIDTKRMIIANQRKYRSEINKSWLIH